MHNLKSIDLYRFALAALTLVVLKGVQAAPSLYQDPDSIRAAAERAVLNAAGRPAAELSASVDSLDPRLRLAACDAALHAQLSGDGQVRDHTTVAVRCESPVRWTLYISVAVYNASPVLVARRALARDAVPSAADFTRAVRRLPGLSSRYVSDVAQLAGQRLRRPVALGEALGADALQAATLVHRGQQLTLLAHADGMDVRVTVVALMDGRPDELIRVQNPGTQRVVEATVRSAQLVEINL